MNFLEKFENALKSGHIKAYYQPQERKVSVHDTIGLKSRRCVCLCKIS